MMTNQRICWNENFKIRLASCDDSLMKHDVIKLMIVKKLMNLHKKDKYFIRIYTEHQLENNCIADVYYENVRTKEVIVYEIQKEATSKWVKKKEKEYEDWKVFGFKTADLIIVPLKEAPDNIIELNNWLDKYIF